MCIIAIKESGKKLISEDVLEHCWHNNGDGAGYAYFLDRKNTWKVKKGFMDFNSFIESYRAENFTDDVFYMIHFRFGTSGNKDGGNTHPFQLFKTLDEMRITEYESKYIAFHNGVCGSGHGIYSDSMSIIDLCVNPLWKVIVEHPKYEESLIPILEYHLNTLKNASRWAITNRETVKMYGNWETDENGVDWSNDMYKFETFTSRHPNKPQPKVISHIPKVWNNKLQKYEVWDSQQQKYVSEEEYKEKYPNVNLTTSGGAWSGETHGFHSGFTSSKPYRLENGVLIGQDMLRSIDHSNAYINILGDIEWENEQNEVFAVVQCPNCFRDDDLEESAFVDGDIFCNSCGTVFKKDTGEITFTDPERSERSANNG